MNYEDDLSYDDRRRRPYRTGLGGQFLNQIGPSASLHPAHQAHGDHFAGRPPVMVGEHRIYATGTSYLHHHSQLSQFGLLLPVADFDPKLLSFGQEVVWLALVDFGGVPESWATCLKQVVIPALERATLEERRIVTFCMGSHGRTGTILASLIALLEPGVEDPIHEVRVRHCAQAVETWAQAEAIFALLGRPVPDKYRYGLRDAPTFKSDMGQKPAQLDSDLLAQLRRKLSGEL